MRGGAKDRSEGGPFLPVSETEATVKSWAVRSEKERVLTQYRVDSRFTPFRPYLPYLELNSGPGVDRAVGPAVGELIVEVGTVLSFCIFHRTGMEYKLILFMRKRLGAHHTFPKQMILQWR